MPRIPTFSFSGYALAVFVGLFVGTISFFVANALLSDANGHVATLREVMNGVSEVVRFSFWFALVAAGPTALVGSIILAPAIMWATRSGIRPRWATAAAGACATGLLLLLPSLVMGYSSGSPGAALIPFAFMPAGALAALTHRAVVPFRFTGGIRRGDG